MGKFFIPRGDTFDLDFSDYQFDAHFEQARKLMRDRRFSVGETGVAYRVINHWDQLNVLPKGARTEGAGWRKFTLPEMIWLRVAIRMRNFGLSLEKIALATKQVMVWDEKKRQYPLFEYYVAKACFSNTDPYVLILSTGEADVASMAEIEMAKLFYGSFDVLMISLKSIAKEVGLTSGRTETLFSLTDKEIELLNKIRVERNNEVKTKIDENGDITEIESTLTSTDKTPSHEINKTAKAEKMYGNVVTQFEDGIQKSVKITKRQKFKK